MKRNHPLLCSPIQVGNITLRNRMAAAPTGGVDILPGGGIGRRSTAFYELKAKGGASVVTVGEVIVHEETDCSPMFHLSDDTAAGGMLSTFSYTADAIRRHGAIPCLQLSHGGCFAALQLGKDKYGVSEVTDQARLAEIYPYTCGNIKEELAQNGPLPVIRELSKEQIHEIVKAYGKTAGLAKRAGFGMIQIHCGHGWLINQFFSPAHNHRTDEYGGSIENRCRFALEVIESVRNAVGPGFPIEVRISGRESIPGGYGLDTAVEICRILDPYVDLFHISAGSHHIDYKVTHTSPFMPYGCNVEMAAEIKKTSQSRWRSSAISLIPT